MTEPIRLAILGCGAITRSEHIPAVSAHPGVHLVALVDTDLPRANALIENRGLNLDRLDEFLAVAKADALESREIGRAHV